MEPAQQDKPVDDAQARVTESLVRELTRLQMWEIWQAGKQGLALDAENARLYEVMEHHMQHAALWDRLDTASDEDVMENGVNLVLHVRFHHIVENQMAEEYPPAVRQVMHLLMQKGMKEHDAAHAIASVVAWEVYNILKEQRPYDEKRYVRALRKLPLQVKSQAGRKK